MDPSSLGYSHCERLAISIAARLSIDLLHIREHLWVNSALLRIYTDPAFSVFALGRYINRGFGFVYRLVHWRSSRWSSSASRRCLVGTRTNITERVHPAISCHGEGPMTLIAQCQSLRTTQQHLEIPLKQQLLEASYVNNPTLFDQ